jgi:hypothetical protein
MGGHSTRSIIENQDTTLRLPAFHGIGRDDAKNIGLCMQAIFSMKRVTSEASKITQLETTFKDKAMMWYMKYKATAPLGQVRSLI